MMQVSTKTEYGLRCLNLLARQADGGSLSISQIAQQEHLPRHYIQQILLRLRRAGVVKSIRGTEGGFALASKPSQISVGQVVRVLEGVPFEDTCSRFNQKSNCGHMGECSIRPVWQLISHQLWKTLDGITLDTLVNDETVVGHQLKKELPVLYR
jgi:Rrf2 family protein